MRSLHSLARHCCGRIFLGYMAAVPTVFFTVLLLSGNLSLAIASCLVVSLLLYVVADLHWGKTTPHTTPTTVHAFRAARWAALYGGLDPEQAVPGNWQEPT